MFVTKIANSMAMGANMLGFSHTHSINAVLFGLTILVGSCATARAGGVTDPTVGPPSVPAGAETTVPASTQPAEPPKVVTLSVLYKADMMGVVSGGEARRGRTLDDLDVAADFDLQQGLGINGLSAHVDAMMTSGGAPDDAVGLLQGVNNIEVARRATRLYQAYVEQAVAGGAGSIRVGFSDLNSEFYVTDSSGVLIGPAFGIGPELAATGRNGPSIFPSTSLAMRGRIRFGADGYLLGGLYNADARDAGDPGGPDWHGRDGALAIAEAGLTRGGKLAVGAWSYTRKAPAVGVVGAAPETAQGVYLLVERDLISGGDAGTSVTGFLRGGVSDGRTGPFSGSVQLGFKASRVVRGRAESTLSVGYSGARLSRGYRTDNGLAGRDEQLVEVTYSDRLTPHLSVQPDLQWTRNAGVGRGRDALVAGLRLTANY
jgi:porin